MTARFGAAMYRPAALSLVSRRFFGWSRQTRPGRPTSPAGEPASSIVKSSGIVRDRLETFDLAAEATGTSGIAQRYALALFELADEAKALDAVAADLASLRDLIETSADLHRLVVSPAMDRTDQGQAMAGVLAKGSAHALTQKFVAVVCANRRLFVLPAMIRAYLAELAARRGEVTAEVSSAMALDEAQTAALTDQLRKVMGAKVQVEATVDPSLLGGLIVKVGSRMVDASLRTKLNKLQLAMKGVG